jgi:hypothetical protein
MMDSRATNFLDPNQAYDDLEKVVVKNTTSKTNSHHAMSPHDQHRTFVS